MAYLFHKICPRRLTSVPSLSLMLSVALPFLVWGRRGDTFTKGNMCPVFRQKGEGGQRTPPVSAISPLPSAPNIPYAEVVYFGVAYSDIL